MLSVLDIKLFPELNLNPIFFEEIYVKSVIKIYQILLECNINIISNE